MAKVEAVFVVPSVAAQLVLESQQNGAAVIDFGAATTGIAIYEEGDGGVTSDWAIGLRIRNCEVVKLAHARFVASGEVGDEG